LLRFALRCLAESTNRLARLARCSAPALMVSTQRRSRSPSSDVASRSLMARMPVSGVRTSWANAASAASTTLDAGARLCTLLALAADLRFAARLFGARFLRWSRDFAAMIHPAPPPAPPWHAGLSESPEVPEHPKKSMEGREVHGYRPHRRPTRAIRADRWTPRTWKACALFRRESVGGAGRPARVIRAGAAAGDASCSPAPGPAPSRPPRS